METWKANTNSKSTSWIKNWYNIKEYEVMWKSLVEINDKKKQETIKYVVSRKKENYPNQEIKARNLYPASLEIYSRIYIEPKEKKVLEHLIFSYEKNSKLDLIWEEFLLNLEWEKAEIVWINSISWSLKNKSENSISYKDFKKNSEYNVFNHKCFLIMWDYEIKKLNKLEKESFENFRNSNNSVEIVTFNELFEKVKTLLTI